MKTFLILCILVFSLFGNTPKIYTSLGDAIYNNLINIQSLSKLKEYDSYREKIDTYTSDVNKAKELGFEIALGEKSELKLDYLKNIRKLAKVNEYFLRSVNTNFKKALKTHDNNLFIALVNSKMLNTAKYKKEILRYYKQNKDALSSVGIIQKYLNEEKTNKKKRKKYTKTKKQGELDRIKRIRKNDKLNQEAFERNLDKELEEKKKKIRETQERELFN